MAKKSLPAAIASRTKGRKFDWAVVSQEGYNAYTKRDHATCRARFTEALKHLERDGCRRNDIRVGYSCMLLGYCDVHEQHFAEAQPFLRRAARIYEHHDQQKEAEILLWLGTCYMRRKHFQRAARVFLEAADVVRAHKPDDKGRYCMLIGNAVQCYWIAGRYDDVLPLARLALQAASTAAVGASVANGLAEKLICMVTAKNAYQTPVFDDLLKLAVRGVRLAQRRAARLEAPATEQHQQHDTYFGVAVSDPYRWLEDTQAQPVKDWLKKQVNHAEQYFNALPGQAKVLERVQALFSVETPHLRRRVGDYFFWEHYPPGKGYKQIFRQEISAATGALVFDAAKLPKNALLYNYSISPNGEMMVYAVAPNGSDWHTVKVRDFKTGADLEDALPELHTSSIAWKQDNSGFYYCAFTRGHERQRILFHKLGTPSSHDPVIHKYDDADVLMGITVTLGGRYLMLYTRRAKSQRYSVALKRVRGRRHPPIMLFPEQPYQYRCIGQSADTLFFSTDKNAPMNRIVSVRIDLKKHTAGKVRGEVPQRAEMLKRAYFWNGKLFLLYGSEEGETFELIERNHKKLISRPVTLPGNAAVDSCSFAGWPKMEICIQGPTMPNVVYEIDYSTAEMRLSDSQRPLIDIDEYTTEKLYARSKDGARVPFYVSYKKGLVRNGDNPTILSGYGGFDRKTTPSFNHYSLAWMEQGGVCVEAVLRGDGDMGREWRDQGTGHQKQKTFDDFIAIAKSLIKKGFTRPARLGITGASNGGLLVAAAITQRPELFGAVAINNGLLDMLRFKEFDFARHYISEYGSADKESDFRALYAYSPLHRLRRRSYPAVLLHAATNDDRVTPAHSYKFAATLQHMQTGDAPVVLSVETNAGHYGQQQSMRGVRELAFFGTVLGLMPDCYLRSAAVNARAQLSASARAARRANS